MATIQDREAPLEPAAVAELMRALAGCEAAIRGGRLKEARAKLNGWDVIVRGPTEGFKWTVEHAVEVIARLRAALDSPGVTGHRIYRDFGALLAVLDVLIEKDEERRG